MKKQNNKELNDDIKEVKALALTPDENEKKIVKDIMRITGVRSGTDVLRMSLKNYHNQLTAK